MLTKSMGKRKQLLIERLAIINGIEKDMMAVDLARHGGPWENPDQTCVRVGVMNEAMCRLWCVRNSTISKARKLAARLDAGEQVNGDHKSLIGLYEVASNRAEILNILITEAIATEIIGITAASPEALSGEAYDVLFCKNWQVYLKPLQAKSARSTIQDMFAVLMRSCGDPNCPSCGTGGAGKPEHRRNGHSKQSV